MPTGTVNGLIFDSRGNIMQQSAASAYQGPADSDGLRIIGPNLLGDWAAMLRKADWQQAIRDCRWLKESYSLIAGAVRQKWEYISASDWRPAFCGEDNEWGDEAEEALNDADKLASVRGPRFPFSRIFELGGQNWETDGAFFLLLTESDTKFPQFQPLESHRIGQRSYESSGVVKTGDAFSMKKNADGTETRTDTAYVGLHILNGIITNDAGMEVAYRVLGGTKEEDEDITARDLWHVANPMHFSENRPLGNIAHGILDFWDTREGRDSVKQQMIIDGRLTFIETTATGSVDPVRGYLENGRGAPVLASGTPTQVIEKGHTRTIKSGNTLTAHEAKRPSDQWMNFDDKILMAAFYGMGWRFEMLNMNALGGASARGFQDIINTTISASFKAMRPYVIRARQYQVAKLIQRGDLAAHDEFLKWDCPAPPEFTVDPSRSIKTDLEAVRAGAEAISDVHRRWGRSTKEVYTAAAKSELLRQSIAKTYGVDPDRLGNLNVPGQLPSGAVNPAAPTEPFDLKNV